eukprot:14562823-Heterocapsa_arctica.AAC.1
MAKRISQVMGRRPKRARRARAGTSSSTSRRNESEMSERKRRSQRKLILLRSNPSDLGAGCTQTHMTGKRRRQGPTSGVDMRGVNRGESNMIFRALAQLPRWQR